MNVAQRQNINTFDSEEVQGEGSWVKVRAVPYGEAKANMRRAAEAATDEDRLKLGEQAIASYVVEWNWVGDDGKPLPQIHGDPTVLDLLTGAEMGFLKECINGERSAQKKA